MDTDPIRRFNQSLISEFSFSLTILLLVSVANFGLFLKLQCGQLFNSSISSMGTSLGVQDWQIWLFGRGWKGLGLKTLDPRSQTDCTCGGLGTDTKLAECFEAGSCECVDL